MEQARTTVSVILTLNARALLEALDAAGRESRVVAATERKAPHRMHPTEPLV
jgi:hypothetical protein